MQQIPIRVGVISKPKGLSISSAPNVKTPQGTVASEAFLCARTGLVHLLAAYGLLPFSLVPNQPTDVRIFGGSSSHHVEINVGWHLGLSRNVVLWLRLRLPPVPSTTKSAQAALETIKGWPQCIRGLHFSPCSSNLGHFFLGITGCGCGCRETCSSVLINLLNAR